MSNKTRLITGGFLLLAVLLIGGLAYAISAKNEGKKIVSTQESVGPFVTNKPTAKEFKFEDLEINDKYYSTEDSGISFEYSSLISKPKVNREDFLPEIKDKQKTNKFEKINFTAEVYNKVKASDVEETTILFIPEDQEEVITVTYVTAKKEKITKEEIAAQIIDSAVISVITEEENPVDTSAPTLVPSPTNVPTPDPSQAGECIYGCVSEEKFE